MKKLILIFGLFFLISSIANAAVIKVPRNFSTIQEAVNYAVDGDKIMVDGSYVGYGALIQDKSLTLVGGSALIIDGPFYNGYLKAGFLVRGAASSGTSISHFAFQDLQLPIFVKPNYPGDPSVADITISHNTILGTAARQAITLVGTKRAMVCYNRIEYANYAIVVVGNMDFGSEAFTAKHNVIDYSQYLLRGYTGIAIAATRGAVITHNKIKMPLTYGQAIWIRNPVGDESQIISYNDFRGSAWDYWDSESHLYWPDGPFTPMYPVIYERNFSDAGCFPTENRGVGIPQRNKKEVEGFTIIK